MAFSFGTSTPASTPTFGFGGGSTPAFGAASAPAFATAASTPSFGVAMSTPAFGAPASAPSLFGAQPVASTPASTPSLFGASATPSLFGATSTPSVFGATSTPSLFGAQPAPGAAPAASTPSFGFGTGALVTTTATPSLFGGAAAQPAAGAGAQQYQSLVTKDNRPLTHTTKWDDLSPQAQAYLLELETKVVQFREECQQLDGDERLGRGKNGKQPQPLGSMEEGARLLSQRITSLGTLLRTDSETCEAVQELVRRLLRYTETALHTFKRSYLWREGLKSTQGQALPSHVMEALSGPVVLPSLYLREAVAGFQQNLAQYAACAAELDQVLCQQQQQYDAGRLLSGGAGGNPADLLVSLQSALTNLYSLLIHAAAKLQAVDDRVAAAREACLAARQQRGDFSDPFADAERQQRSDTNSGGGGDAQVSAATPAPQQQAAPAAGVAPAAPPPSPFATTLPAPAAAPGGLFGTLTSAASTPFGGTASGFGTPLFGGAGSGATVRKGKGKK